MTRARARAALAAVTSLLVLHVPYARSQQPPAAEPTAAGPSAGASSRKSSSPRRSARRTSATCRSRCPRSTATSWPIIDHRLQDVRGRAQRSHREQRRVHRRAHPRLRLAALEQRLRAVGRACHRRHPVRPSRVLPRAAVRSRAGRGRRCFSADSFLP